MFCTNCGKQLQEGSKFCSACGTQVHVKEPNVEEQYAENNSLSEKIFETKAAQKAIWISIVAVICLIAIVTTTILVAFFSKSESSNSSQNDNSSERDNFLENFDSTFIDDSAEKYHNSYNMTGNVYIARNDNYIFYVGTSDNVIRMDADFGNRTSILEGKGIDSIYMIGETLYFHSSKDYHVYSSDFNGENIQKITPLKNCWFAITGGKLYFIEGYYMYDEDMGRYDAYGEFALYRADLDGSNYEKVIDSNVSMVSVQDDNIVYFDTLDNVIYVTNLDATDHRALHTNTDEDFIYEYKVYKNKLYYTISRTSNENLSGIYCIDINTGDVEKIIATIPGAYTFYKDSIIYAADTNSSKSATHICDLDGNSDEILSEDIFYQPIVMGDYLYFCGSDLSTKISVFNLKTKEIEAFETIRYTDMEFTDNYIFYIDSKDQNIYRCDFDGKNVVKLTNSKGYRIYTYQNCLYYDGYANGYTPDNDETPSGVHPSGFFKLDENGKECYAVELNAGSNIVFYNDYIYFSSPFDSHLYRTKINNIDTDDTNRPFIRRSGEGHYSTIYFIENDWIYFSYWRTSSGDSATVARMSLDGDDMQIVIESSAYDLTVYDNKIYYLKRDTNDNWQLRRVNMDGTNDILMLKSDISEYLIVDNVIYYIDNTDKNIYRLNLDGTKRIQLTKTACDGLSIYGNRIYYTDLYDHGYVYSMMLDGSDCTAIIKDNKQFTEKTDYKTSGIDDAASAKEENKDVSFSANDVMTFEDPEFEEFLCEMFQKEKGTITGADLLSIKFFGYYEGAPDEISVLMNRGTYRYLYENSVLFSTETYPTDVDEIDVLCGDDSVDGEIYREGCTVMTVRSNEWMAEHVMPYLYYFKNMKHVAFGYCWVGDNPVLPIGVDWNGINPHGRYVHEPYDPLYW